jgi:predicted transcriptional regulator
MDAESTIVVNDDAPTLKRLAALIKSRRERKGWSQQNLADFTKTSRDVIKHLEAGNKDPRASVVFQVLAVLDCSEQDIKRVMFGQVVAKRVP